MKIETKYNLGDYVSTIYKDDTNKWLVLGYGNITGIKICVRSSPFTEEKCVDYEVHMEAEAGPQLFLSVEVFPNKVQALEECKRRNNPESLWQKLTK